MLDDVFRGSEAVALGLVTWDRLCGPRFRRLFPDVYLPAERGCDLSVRSRAAYQLVGTRGGVLAGYSAARLLGADCAPREASAEVLMPRRYRPRPGLVIRYGRVRDEDVAWAAGCRVTSASRTAWDLARRLALVEAVVAVDSLAHRREFEPADLLARRAAEPGARGCRRLDRIVALADPRAESPGETRLRLLLIVRGGLPAPSAQFRVRNEYGVVVARVDLAYPEAKPALEYDGIEHYTRARAERDRARDAELAGLGWETVRVGRDDVDAARTVALVRDLLVTRSR